MEENAGFVMKREESAAMMVGTCCVHQRAPGARGTEPVASFWMPSRGSWQIMGCAGKSWRPQGRRMAWLLKMTSLKNKQEVSQAPQLIAALTDCLATKLPGSRYF